MTSQKEWSWRDAGRHGPLIRSVNLASALIGFSRKPFVPVQLIDKAIRRTGLDDFGDPSFREGLERLCADYSNDRRMTGLGQIVGREMVVGTLAKRLQLIDWHKTHAECASEEIRAPWVITGLVRSGTTLGAALIDLDARVRSPLVWETESPIPPAMIATQYCDPRIAASARQLEQLYRLIPPLRAIHPMEACSPQECVVIMQLNFQSIMFQAISLAEDYMAWYNASDKLAGYRLHKQLWQVWQSTIPTERWGSKSPDHMHGIAEFMAVYPDARMIWSHRDPLVCIPSIAGFSFSCLRTFNPNADPVQAGQAFNRHWLNAIRKMIAYDRSRPDRDWCHHLYYDDLVANPVESLRQAYRHFGDGIDRQHERKIQAWMRQRPKNAFGVHKYSLDDFGLDARKMREDYAEYMERYSVPIEYKP